MVGILEINIERVIKHGLCLIKGNSVLGKICRRLCFIPLKSHGLHLSTVPGAGLRLAKLPYPLSLVYYSRALPSLQLIQTG